MQITVKIVSCNGIMASWQTSFEKLHSLLFEILDVHTPADLAEFEARVEISFN